MNSNKKTKKIGDITIREYMDICSNSCGCSNCPLYTEKRDCIIGNLEREYLDKEINL